MPLKINTAEFEREVLSASSPVLADFYSDSCIPCKRMSPILTQLENEYSDKLKIVKININFEKELVEKYTVQAAPTLILFKGGEETDRIRGAAKKEDIIALIDKAI